MRVALAQINSTMGDFPGNREKIQQFIERAHERRCDLVVFPELALFGYPPNDLLERRHVVKHQLKELKAIAAHLPNGMAALVGAVIPVETIKKQGPPPLQLRPFYNCAVWLENGKTARFFSKQCLPQYDIFDEGRHFQSASQAASDQASTVEFKGRRFLVAICEDLWSRSGVFEDLKYGPSFISRKPKKKIDMVLGINASPFALGKSKKRESIARDVCRRMGAPLVYVNLVGGQDELIFDGGSFVMAKDGKLMSQSLFFEEDLNVMDFGKKLGGFRPHTNKVSDSERLRQALVLGLRDFVAKQSLVRVHLGLSGGVDSAVVACLAVDALGPSKVTAFGLPGPFSAPESLKLARDLAQNLGCDFRELSIEPAYDLLKSQLDREFGVNEFQLYHENLQARLRGLMLMAAANFKNSLLLTTGNKSEYATGYATLYGDMCGGLAPIADLLKGQVWELARHYNQGHELIPKRIIDRPPTAELRAHQTDQDTLPPYQLLDKMVENLVVHRKPARTEKEVWLAKALVKSEFKRWQAPPVLRVSEHAFGRGRRMPLVNKLEL